MVDLDIPKGDLILSFYLLDYDWYNGEHPRIESILLLDRTSGKPVALAPTGRFGEGVYERFYVKGPRQITARINKHRSPCAVVSGVFLDRVPEREDKRQAFGGGSSDSRVTQVINVLRTYGQSRAD